MPRDGDTLPVPEGFPHKLTDVELDETATHLAGRLRNASASGLGVRDSAELLGYAALLDTARGESFRRHLQRSERLSRVALGVAITSAVVATALSIVSVHVT